MSAEDRCEKCGQKVEDPTTNFRVPYVHATVDSELVEIYVCDKDDVHDGEQCLELEKPEVAEFIVWLQQAILQMNGEDGEEEEGED